MQNEWKMKNAKAKCQMVSLALPLPARPCTPLDPASNIKFKYDKIECAAFLFAGNYCGCETGGKGWGWSGLEDMHVDRLVDGKRGVDEDGGGRRLLTLG